MTGGRSLSGGILPPTFTVVIPTHQSRELVAGAIRSVLTQTDQDFEIVVIDNGSTDGTDEAVSGFGDPRIRYFWQEDSGLPADSRNKGVEAAQGSWISFLDADDTWSPEKLARVRAAIHSDPNLDVIGHDVDVVGPDGEPLGSRSYRLDDRDFWDQLLYRGNFLTTSAITVRSIALRAAGGFDTRQEYFTVEDYDLWLRLAAGGSRFGIIPETLGTYVVHPGGASSRLVRHYDALMRVYRDHTIEAANKGTLDSRAALARLRRSRLAETRDLALRWELVSAAKVLAALPHELSTARAAYRVASPTDASVPGNPAAPASSGHSPLDGVRVVMVNNFAGPGLGGGEVQNLALLRALISAGAELHLVVPPHSDLGRLAADEGARVTTTQLSLRRTPQALRAIRRTVSTDGQTVLMGTGYWTNLLVRFASRGSIACVVNVVAVVPGASLLDGGSRLALAVRRLADRLTDSRVDAFVAVAGAVADGIVANGVARERVHVIHNGVDVERLNAEARGSAWTPPPGRPLLVCAARLERVKGVQDLIRSMVHLPDARLVIAGDGPLSDQLREQVETLGLGDRVTFLGQVSPVAPTLAKADLVVIPSLSEGLPLIALEALALGRPVVATRVGGIPEVIEDGVTGLLVEPGDPKALAAAIDRVVGDPRLAHSVGDAGRELVRSHFSDAAMGAAYVELLTTLLEGR